MSQRLVINVTGASSGFGALAARKLALSGHTVFAGLHSLRAETVQDIKCFADEHKVDLRYIQQDMLSDESVNQSVKSMISQAGKVDSIVHNCGHMVFGPLESFTVEQLAQQYNINVLSTQRLNRAVLPHMRQRGSGLLVWVGSTSVHGAPPPFLAPYFAAKAGMEALAMSYELELSQWGIESCIVIPGAYTKGTNHFAHAGQPGDAAVAEEYRKAGAPYEGMEAKANEALKGFEPASADVSVVADEIVRVVNGTHGSRPRTLHIDPAQDGAEIVRGVRERFRRDRLQIAGLQGLFEVRKH